MFVLGIALIMVGGLAAIIGFLLGVGFTWGPLIMVLSGLAVEAIDFARWNREQR